MLTTKQNRKPWDTPWLNMGKFYLKVNFIPIGSCATVDLNQKMIFYQMDLRKKQRQGKFFFFRKPLSQYQKAVLLLI
jgi:hypothetical protein